MNKEMTAMFSEAEGRYLEGEEAQKLLQFASSLNARLETMEAVQAAEDRIVGETIEEVWSAHPGFERKHDKAGARCTRDVTLVLRYCAMAMVRQDMKFLRDKLLYWLRTILQSFHFGEVIDTTYRMLPRRVEHHLTPGQVKLLAPYLKEAHRVLTLDSLEGVE